MKSQHLPVVREYEVVGVIQNAVGGAATSIGPSYIFITASVWVTKNHPVICGIVRPVLERIQLEVGADHGNTVFG